MDLKKVMDSLNSEMVDEMVNKLIAEEEKRKAYIHTIEFKRNFKKLKDYLDKNESFATDGIFYTETEKEQEFANNAIRIFSSIEYNTDEYINTDEEMFPTIAFEYEGVKMSVMMGQGSAWRFWLK